MVGGCFNDKGDTEVEKDDIAEEEGTKAEPLEAGRKALADKIENFCTASSIHKNKLFHEEGAEPEHERNKHKAFPDNHEDVGDVLSIESTNGVEIITGTGAKDGCARQAIAGSDDVKADGTKCFAGIVAANGHPTDEVATLGLGGWIEGEDEFARSQ